MHRILRLAISLEINGSINNSHFFSSLLLDMSWAQRFIIFCRSLSSCSPSYFCYRGHSNVCLMIYSLAKYWQTPTDIRSMFIFCCCCFACLWFMHTMHFIHWITLNECKMSFKEKNGLESDTSFFFLATHWSIRNSTQKLRLFFHQRLIILFSKLIELLHTVWINFGRIKHESNSMWESIWPTVSMKYVLLAWHSAIQLTLAQMLLGIVMGDNHVSLSFRTEVRFY